jgi:hypothetical protein
LNKLSFPINKSTNEKKKKLCRALAFAQSFETEKMLMMLMLLLLLDLGFVGSTQQAVGESGGEDSEDEWNYIKVDKKSSEGLAAVTEEISEVPESPVVEEREEISEENKENVS